MASEQRTVSVQTDPYAMYNCGCDEADVAAEIRNVNEELQASEKAYVTALIASKETELKMIRNFMKNDVKQAKKKPWCTVCLEEARTYVNGRYYCSARCVRMNMNDSSSESD